MVTFFQIVVILLIIALIAMVLGYIFGQFACKRIAKDHFIQKGDYCENEYAQKEGLYEQIDNSELEILEEAQSSKNNTYTPKLLDAPTNKEPDNLCKIKGIGKVIEQKLNDLGIFYFEQIASWEERDIEWIDKHLSFSGRIVREDWVGQAKLLAKGEETEFSKRVEKGEVESSRKD